MPEMKRSKWVARLAAGVVTLVLLGGLVGCSKGDDGTAPGTGAAAPKPGAKTEAPPQQQGGKLATPTTN